MLEQFFEHETNRAAFQDYDACQTWAKEQLENCNFVWVQLHEVSFSTMSGSPLTSSLPQEPPIGLMRAPFVLRVFATHLNSIVGAEDVPELERVGSAGDVSSVSRYPPVGALALALTAVSMFSL